LNTISIFLLQLFFSPRGCSPYTNTVKINNNEIYINETIQKHSKTIQNTVNTSKRIAKTPTQLSKHTHITKHTRTHIKKHRHTLQNKLKQT